MTNSIYNAATYYVELKLPIIPLCNPEHSHMPLSHLEKCNSPGKVPLIQWKDYQHTTLEKLDSWMKKFHDINIGLVLGSTKHWNLVGVDIDGALGEKLWTEITKKYGAPSTWEFTTGGGGRRLLYRLPSHIQTRKHKIEWQEGHQELAFLANGQQTVLPPSRHISGRDYQWTEGLSPVDIDISTAPPWLIKFVTKPKEEKSSTPVTIMDTQEDKGEGSRSDWLARIVGSMCSRLDVGESVIFGMASTQNKLYCKPPLSEAEVKAMVHSIWESEKQKKQRREDQRRKRAELNPHALARMFIATENSKGRFYLYSLERDTFYTTTLQQGPWNRIETVTLESHISGFLEEIDPLMCRSHHIKELKSALKRELQQDNRGKRLDIGKFPLLNKLVLKNGILEWKTGTLSPWSPELVTTLSINASWMPQNEKLREIKNMWEKALISWLPEEESRMFLQEYIGYCLLPTCARRIAVFLLGAGANGKSLFIETIARLFQSSVAHVQPATLTQRFGTTAIIDKTLVICSDIDATYINSTGTLKQLIAGDAIQGEYKGGKIFDFVPVARLLFSANVLPKSSDRSHGWYSRIRIINFPNTFKPNPQYKHTLLDTMKTEEGLHVLLSWAVEGLQRLEKNNAFTRSLSMEKEMNTYKMDNNSVLFFWTNQIVDVLEGDPRYDKREGGLVASSVYNLYQTWCEETGQKPVSKIEFGKRLQLTGVKSKTFSVKKKGRRSTARYYLNVQLNEAAEYDLSLDYKLENVNIQ